MGEEGGRKVGKAQGERDSPVIGYVDNFCFLFLLWLRFFWRSALSGTDSFASDTRTGAGTVARY